MLDFDNSQNQTYVADASDNAIALQPSAQRSALRVPTRGEIRRRMFGLTDAEADVYKIAESYREAGLIAEDGRFFFQLTQAVREVCASLGKNYKAQIISLNHWPTNDKGITTSDLFIEIRNTKSKKLPRHICATLIKIPETGEQKLTFKFGTPLPSRYTNMEPICQYTEPVPFKIEGSTEAISASRMKELVSADSDRPMTLAKLVREDLATSLG